MKNIYRTYPFKLVVLALAYYLSGRLGLWLAIPPGQATAVWPASGIALAGMLLFGTRYWPGVFLGAMGTSLYHPDVIDSKALAIAAAIAAGASLQAVLGGRLVRRRLNGDFSLRNLSDIFALILLGGFASCLVNSIFATGTLHVVGFVPTADLTLHWFTWWAGDVVGVVVFTPILLLVLAPEHTARRSRQAIVGATLLFVFVVVIVLFHIAKEQDGRQRRLDFAGSTARVTQEIERDLASHTNVLTATERFVFSIEDLTHHNFREFTLEFLEQNAEIRNLSWNPRVSGNGREAFEARIREDGFPEFAIRDRLGPGTMGVAPPRDVYFPTTYLAPLEGNELAHGLDAYGPDAAGDNIRRCAMDRAVISDGAVATDRLSIVQAEHEYGLIAYRPVYYKHGSTHSEEGRHEALRGFVAGVFVFPEMMSVANDLAGKLNLSFVLTDLEDTSAQQVLFDSRTPDFKESVEEPEARPGQLVSETRIDFAGKTWKLRFIQDSSAYAGKHNWALWAVLIGGMMFVGLIGTFMLPMTARTEAVERLVEERTVELQDARIRAEEATRAKSDFLSNMSHELRTPMNSIIGFTRLVIRKSGGTLDPSDLEALQVVDRNSEHLLNLINELLDVSKIEAGKMTLDKTEVDLVGMVREAVKTLTPLAETRSLSLVSKLPAAPVLLFADRTKLNQVLMNLVSNGVKYTDSGSVTVTLTSPVTENGHAMTRISVKDTGIGMKADELKRLFSHYLQFDSAGARRVGGTGLGLVIAKAYIEMHGGTIEVSSEYGRGSEFIVHLPLSPR